MSLSSGDCVKSAVPQLRSVMSRGGADTLGFPSGALGTRDQPSPAGRCLLSSADGGDTQQLIFLPHYLPLQKPWGWQCANTAFRGNRRDDSTLRNALARIHLLSNVTARQGSLGRASSELWKTPLLWLPLCLFVVCFPNTCPIVIPYAEILWDSLVNWKHLPFALTHEIVNIFKAIPFYKYFQILPSYPNQVAHYSRAFRQRE